MTFSCNNRQLVVGNSKLEIEAAANFAFLSRYMRSCGLTSYVYSAVNRLLNFWHKLAVFERISCLLKDTSLSGLSITVLFMTWLFIFM
jgi:hypothetical protein